MEGACPFTASSPSLKRSSVTPRKALTMRTGLRGRRPLTISTTLRMRSLVATELPPNFMTIIGGTLFRMANHESRITNHGRGERLALSIRHQGREARGAIIHP